MAKTYTLALKAPIPTTADTPIEINSGSSSSNSSSSNREDSSKHTKIDH